MAKKDLNAKASTGERGVRECAASASPECPLKFRSTALFRIYCLSSWKSRYDSEMTEQLNLIAGRHDHYA